MVQVDRVKILVIGDAGVGKSTLIACLQTEAFVEEVPEVLGEVTIPAQSLPEKVSFFSTQRFPVLLSSKDSITHTLLSIAHGVDIAIVIYIHTDV